MVRAGVHLASTKMPFTDLLIQTIHSKFISCKLTGNGCQVYRLEQAFRLFLIRIDAN